MSVEVRYPDGPWYWRTGESIAFTVDTSRWTLTPTSPSVIEVINLDDGSDDKATVMPSGTASATNSIITLPLFTAATVGQKYRIEVQFTGDNASVLRCHGWVEAGI